MKRSVLKPKGLKDKKWIMQMCKGWAVQWNSEFCFNLLLWDFFLLIKISSHQQPGAALGMGFGVRNLTQCELPAPGDRPAASPG